MTAFLKIPNSFVNIDKISRIDEPYKQDGLWYMDLYLEGYMDLYLEDSAKDRLLVGPFPTLKDASTWLNQRIHINNPIDFGE